MARYEITSPDGKRFEVTAPDGATQDDVLAYAQTQWKPAPKPYRATDDMSTLERGVAGFGKVFADSWRGAKQIGSKIGIGDEKAVQQEIDDAKKYDADLMSTGGGMAGNLAGNVAQAVAIPGGSTVKGAATIGALMGAAQPVASDESRLLNTVGGGVAGGAGQTVAKGIGALARGPANVLTPAERELAAKAEAMGIQLTPAQKTGNKFLQTVDSVMEKMPATSATQTAARAEQSKQFTRALTKTFGEVADDIGEGTMSAAKKAASAEYEAVFAGEKIPVQTGVLDKFSSTLDEAKRYLSGDQAKVVANRIDDILAKVEDDGAVAGKAYQKWRSDVKSSDGDVNHYLKQVKSAMDEAATAAISPEKMSRFIANNTKYKNMKTVEPLAEKSTNGMPSPALLLNRVRASYPDMAYSGAGDIGDVAKIGKAFIREPVNDSGTAQRLLAQSLLSGGIGGGAWAGSGDLETGLKVGGGAMASQVALPKLIQALLSRPGVQNYLGNGGMKNVDPRLIEALMKGSTALPVGTAMTVQ